MKIKTDNFIQKLIVSKLFSYKYYHNIKLHKIIFDFRIGKDYENLRKIAPLLLNKNAIVLDIGANMGQYACRLNKIIEGGKIYSFEPYKENYNALVKMKKMLHLDKVEPFHLAISDKKGKMKLLIPIVNNSLIVGTQAVLSEYHQKKFENVKYFEEYVDTITIDNFVTEYHLSSVDFIKIDTEGAEISVLKGGLETIKKFLPVLSVETPPSNPDLNFLYEMGYKAHVLLNGKIVQFKNDSVNLEGNTILISKTINNR